MEIRIEIHHDPNSVEKIKLKEQELRDDPSQGDFFVGSFLLRVGALGSDGATLVISPDRTLEIPADGGRHEFEVGGVPCEAWAQAE